MENHLVQISNKPLVKISLVWKPSADIIRNISANLISSSACEICTNHWVFSLVQNSHDFDSSAYFMEMSSAKFMAKKV